MKSRILVKQIISNDKSIKNEYVLEDGMRMESAYFFDSNRERPHIACISTQVGCLVGCLFCAAPKSGFIRNLTSTEIFLPNKRSS